MVDLHTLDDRHEFVAAFEDGAKALVGVLESGGVEVDDVLRPGRGIQRGDVAGTHSLGLLGMRERAELLGGAFDIRGAPGKGTTVTVSIPFTQHD